MQRRKPHIIGSLIMAGLVLSLSANAQSLPEEEPPTLAVADWEQQFVIGLLPGSGSADLKIGAALQYSLLRRWRDYLLVGASAGVSTYKMDAGNTFYPLMLEAKGYLGDVLNWIPYYSAGFGYGFAFRNSRDGIAEAEGGWCGRASLGISRPLRGGGRLLMDAGFQYQRGSSVQSFAFSSDRFTQEFSLQRISLRAGLVF
jgi:hypothetical protein